MNHPKEPKAITELLHEPNPEKESKEVSEDGGIEYQALEKSNLEIPAGEYRYIDISDCKLENLVANNVSTFRSTFVRCRIAGAQLTGLQLPEGNFKDCLFRNCRINLANFRSSKFERCVFIDCDFSEADFGASQFINVQFESCQFSETEFSNCKSQRLEFENQSLAGIRGISGLKGAAITSQNLIEIAAALAREYDITISE